MRTILAWIVLAFSCCADQPIVLVTKSGVWQCDVSAGVPGEWARIDAHVIIHGGETPGPIPTPPPEPPRPTAKNFRVCIVEESTVRTEATANVLEGLIGWNEFLEAGHEYRLYKSATSEPRGKTAIQDCSGIPLPAVVIYDRDTGRKIKAISLPKTIEELKALIPIKPAQSPGTARLLKSLDNANRSAERLRNAI